MSSKVPRSCSQYSMTKKIDSSLGPTATSVTLTMFLCRMRFNMLISRRLDIGMPSISRSIRIFLSATISFVFVSFTLLQRLLFSILDCRLASDSYEKHTRRHRMCLHRHDSVFENRLRPDNHRRTEHRRIQRIDYRLYIA